MPPRSHRIPAGSHSSAPPRVARARAEYPSQLDYSGSCTYASPLAPARFARAARSARSLALLLSAQLGSACVTSAPRASSEGLAPCPEVSATSASKRPPGMCRKKAGGHQRPSRQARRERGQSRAPRPGIDPGSSKRQAQHGRQRPKRVRACSRLASCASRRVAPRSSQAAAARLAVLRS